MTKCKECRKFRTVECTWRDVLPDDEACTDFEAKPPWKEQWKEELKIEEEVREKALELLRDPAFFYKLGEVFEKGVFIPKLGKVRFVIAEERNKRLLPFLLLQKNCLVRVIGDIGTGKDSMVRITLRLLELVLKVVERSYFTPAVIRYSPYLRNADLLYIPDSPALKGEIGRHLRLMRSDDGGLIVEYALKSRETGEMTTKVEKLPIKGLITTSNAFHIDPALESGMWTLKTNSSEELTLQVKKEKLKFRAGKRETYPEEQLKVWQYAFKLLAENMPEKIIIPYAEGLITLLSSKKTASRRDPDKLCDLIETIAKARTFQKPEDMRDKADLIDLYIALQLGLDAMTQTIAELKPDELQIYNIVKELGSATVRDVTEKTKRSYTKCYEILEKLVQDGYLNKDKEGKRNVYTVLREIEEGELSVTFAESSSSPKQLMELAVNCVSNFPTFTETPVKAIDPITGDEITVTNKNGKIEISVVPRKLETSENGKENSDLEQKEKAELSAKDTERLESKKEKINLFKYIELASQKRKIFTYVEFNLPTQRNLMEYIKANNIPIEALAQLIREERIIETLTADGEIRFVPFYLKGGVDGYA